jgi:hypothetical protein
MMRWNGQFQGFVSRMFLQSDVIAPLSNNDPTISL